MGYELQTDAMGRSRVVELESGLGVGLGLMIAARTWRTPLLATS